MNNRDRLFVSYSRADLIFVEKLTQGLSEKGFLVDFDLADDGAQNVDTGISAEDEWWKRIKKQISACHIFVFVVSPSSIDSKVCIEELKHARTLGKRVLPVKLKSVDLSIAHSEISALNVKISFEETDDFFETLDQLVSVASVDIEWLREGSRLLGLAENWEAGGENEGQLLRMEAVTQADLWIAARPQSSPKISALLLNYISESRKKEERDFRDLQDTAARGFVAPAKIAFEEGKYDKVLRLCGAAAVASYSPHLHQSPRLRELAACSIVLNRCAFKANRTSGLTCLVASPSPNCVYAGYSDGAIIEWDLLAGKRVKSFTGHEEGINSLYVSADGRFLSSASGDRWSYHDSSARIWDVGTGQEKAKYNNTDCVCFARTIGRNDEYLLAIDHMGWVNVVSSHTNETLWSGKCADDIVLEVLRPDRATAFVAAPSGEYGAFLNTSNELCFWKIETDEFKEIAHFEGKHCSQVVLSSCGTLVAALHGCSLVVTNLPSLERLYYFGDFDEQPEIAGFSGDSSSFVCLTKSGQIFVWDCKNWDMTHKLETHRSFKVDELSILNISHHGTFGLFWSGTTPQLWNLATGKEIAINFENSQTLPLNIFSPDEKHLAMADGTKCGVYDTSTGRLIHEKFEHEGEVLTLYFDGAGSVVATGCRDGSMSLWNLDAELDVTWRINPKEPFQDAYWSNDGNYLVLCRGDEIEVHSEDRKNLEPFIVKSNDKSVLSAAMNGNILRFIGSEGCLETITIELEVEAFQKSDRRSLSLPLSSANSRESLISTFSETDMTATSQGSQVAKISSDGRFVALIKNQRSSFGGDQSGFAQIYCTETGELLGNTERHGDLVTDVAFSHNSGFVVTTSGAFFDLSSLAFRWDDSAIVSVVASRDKVAKLTDHSIIVETACVLPDTDRVISSSGKVLKEFELSSESALRTCVLPSSATVLSISFDAKFLLATTPELASYLVDVADFRVVGELSKLLGVEVKQTMFRPQRKEVVVIAKEGDVIVADMSSLWRVRAEKLSETLISELRVLGQVPEWERSEIMLSDAPSDLHDAISKLKGGVMAN